MRLFAALPLPVEAHQDVAACLRRLREAEWPVRWVREDGLHLTLKFFGEVTTGRLETIVEMLEFCVRDMAPMMLAVTGAGVFPYPSRPRVIHLDVEAPPALELLQDRIERGAERIGFPPEGRPFRPHITLGRVREGHRLPPGAMDQLDRVEGRPPFVVDRLVLFESVLSPPRYTPRAEFLLQ
jgi:2'-5' RNA ligase